MVHHIFTLAGAKATLTIDHYPWFFMAPFTMHAILLIVPLWTILNYLYLVIIIVCLYKLRQDPWKNISAYIWQFYVGLGIAFVPLVMLWWNGCKNTQEKQ